MARTALSIQQVINTGLTPVYVTPDASGANVANPGNVFLHVKNASASPINVTLVATGKVRGLSIASLVIAVTNAQERMIGPIDMEMFSQADGTVNIDFSAVTSVTVGAFKL